MNEVNPTCDKAVHLLYILHRAKEARFLPSVGLFKIPHISTTVTQQITLLK